MIISTEDIKAKNPKNKDGKLIIFRVNLRRGLAFQFVLVASYESYWFASFDCQTTHSLKKKSNLLNKVYA